jgi:hypothetical protein
MTNLVLQCGARHVPRAQIETSPTPAASTTWQPIAHRRLLELVESTLTSSGLTIVNEAHALWQEGARYFALLEVANGEAQADYAMVVGLRNSHDKSFPAAIALGNQVLCCDNLAFGGEVSLARRHTRFIERDLPRVISTAVGRLTDLRSQQDERISAYKNTALDDRSVHDLIVRAIDASVLPVTQLPHVLAEWRKPSFAEFEEAGHTAWRLFNSFSETWKGRDLARLPRRSQALLGLLDLACGLAV